MGPAGNTGGTGRAIRSVSPRRGERIRTAVQAAESPSANRRAETAEPICCSCLTAADENDAASGRVRTRLKARATVALYSSNTCSWQLAPVPDSARMN